MKMNGTSNETHVSTFSLMKPQECEKLGNDSSGESRRNKRPGWAVVASTLALVITTGLVSSSFYLEYFGTVYLIPLMTLMHFTEKGQGEKGLTYFHRVCSQEDMSTENPNDFVVTKDMPTDEALQLMLKHGASLLPGLLTQKMADPLREFILKENERNQDLIYVIENENRWSFPIQVDQDPSVTAALEELLSNDHLVRLLEAICGPDPAVIEFTAITAAKGATEQYWHQDVTSEGSAAKYARHFIPSYSLFIPLQNTTAEMGATGICPGTHMCSKAEFCETEGFQVSGPTNQWPMGTGALVNQQTTHRGEAHTDGPHRVVFILTFAPRPRVGPFTVETRMIGISGSYSLHWSQWGHTLSDFRQPLRHMRWRLLRCLGIYKSKDRLWGWDYVTSSLMRITHEEFGFGEEDLENFLKKGGMKWLPKFLQGSTSFMEGSTESLWTIYLRNTVKRCHFLFVVLHCVILLGSVVVGACPQRFQHFVGCVAIIHVAWLLGFYQLEKGVQETVWARNIQNKLSNHVPEKMSLASQSSHTTLPLTSDVMRFDKMKSSYMHSFEQVLEVSHPGNAAFHSIIEHYRTGYDMLTRALQLQMRLDINEALNGRRVLEQTCSSGWAEVTTEDRDIFIHEALLSYDTQRQLLREVGFLLSESQFGYHRDSAMHKFHIPVLLANLREKILKVESARKPSFTITRKDRIMSMSFHQNGIAQVTKLIQNRAADAYQNHSEHSFLAVGDSVDAIFGRDFDYWYRGTIVDAKPFRSKWVVEFDDGDVEGNACTECVVASKPFVVGEIVEIRTGDDPDDINYETGQVVAVYDDLTMDVDVEGEAFFGVRPSFLRRPAFELESVTIGDRVYAMYPGAGWFPGTVAQINEDGTVAVNYDDGDFMESVPATDIRFTNVDQ